jgi:very-short-patch-repair endonuclease
MRKSFEDYLKQFKVTHGDRYDYSKVVYVNSSTPITIVCKEHGPFSKLPYDHIKSGCNECYKEGKREQTKDKFVKRAKEIHGDTFDYSDMGFVGTAIKVKLTCNKEGHVNHITPSNHLKVPAIRCSGCSNRSSVDTEEFIRRAKEVHGDKFDYSKVIYKNNVTHVTVICHEHGELQTMPRDFLTYTHGCAKCYQLQSRKGQEDFLRMAKEVHGDTFDYSEVVYVRAHEKVKIKCPKGHTFEQTPNGHLQGAGCLTCSGSKKYTVNTLKLKMNKKHHHKYDYSLIERYENNKMVLPIICPIGNHGMFEQVARDHLRGKGCPKCGRLRQRVGYKEERLFQPMMRGLFKEHEIEFQYEFLREGYHPYYVDAFLPNYNLVVEFDEKIHRYGKTKENDILRQSFIEQNYGVQFFRIDEDDIVSEKETIVEELRFITFGWKEHLKPHQKNFE